LGSAVIIVVVLRALAKAQLPTLTGLQIAFLSGFVSIVVTNFYGFSVVTVALLFFLYPAFSVVLYTKRRFWEWRFTQKVADWEKIQWPRWVGLTTILFAIGYLLLAIHQYWRADKIYASGKTLAGSGSILAGIEQLSRAIQLRPQEAGYHIELAEAAATAAYAYASQDATASALATDQFVALADSETKTALALNPVHLNFYKSAAKIYIVLAQTKPDPYLPLAIRTLEVAEQLSPTDPKITLNLGLLYDQIGQTEKAQQYLEKTVKLKPDYRQGWIYLGQFYEAQKESDKARAAYQYILDHIYAQDAGALEALEKLETQSRQNN
jgi:tetratricopeptide (TPR) repeat protein